jgi:hypothetical protein
MFPYFGDKKTLSGKYPPPTHDTLIEPFCGAAYYSLRHWDRSVWINDKNPVITEIWKYLQKASPESIARLRMPRPGQLIADLPGFSEVERDLIGYLCAANDSRPRRRPPSFKGRWFSPAKWQSRIAYIAENLHKVRHWTITNLDYLDLPDRKGSWFVDAPYQVTEHQYTCRPDDYAVLGEWCRNLRGQVIVCENDLADWLPRLEVLDPALPFNRPCRGNAIECYWTNES